MNVYGALALSFLICEVPFALWNKIYYAWCKVINIQNSLTLLFILTNKYVVVGLLTLALSEKKKSNKCLRKGKILFSYNSSQKIQYILNISQTVKNSMSIYKVKWTLWHLNATCHKFTFCNLGVKQKGGPPPKLGTELERDLKILTLQVKEETMCQGT